jgi:hypothetical protein
VPKDVNSAPNSPTGSKRPAPASKNAESPSKKRKTRAEAEMEQEMKEGEKVQEFAQDTSKKKGDWVRCLNDVAKDELKAHTSMFAPGRNPGYYNMLPIARDRIVGWIDKSWYEDATRDDNDDENNDGGDLEGDDAASGAEESAEAEMAT